MNAVDGKLRALGNPTRREILRRTWQRELPAGQLAEGFAMSRPAVSQHLRVLRDAGLVTVRRDGARKLYSARRGALDDVWAFFEELWAEHLPELKAVAEAERSCEPQGDRR